MIHMTANEMLRLGRRGVWRLRDKPVLSPALQRIAMTSAEMLYLRIRGVWSTKVDAGFKNTGRNYELKTTGYHKASQPRGHS